MASPKPRLTRLTAILTALQAQRLLTATDLAATHQVSVRTIYRDIKTLMESGVPVLTVEGKGYSLMSGYQLPPVMFTQAEASALMTAAALVQRQGDRSLTEHYSSAITKIKAVMRPVQQGQAELLQSRLQVRATGLRIPASQYLIQLQLAITNSQLVQLDYLSLSGSHSQRLVEPFACYGNTQHWILIAYCRLRKDFRSFRLDQIQSVQLLSERFEARMLSLEEYFRKEAKKNYPTPDIPLTVSTASFTAHQQPKPMEKVAVAPFKLIGLSVRTSNLNQQAGQDLAALWGRFMAEKTFEQIPNKVSLTFYCVYTNFSGEKRENYDALLGCQVSSLDEIPAGMIGQEIVVGHAQKRTVKGDIRQGQAVVQAWQEILAAELDRSFTADFEVYDERAMHPENAEVDIYVAVNG